MTVPKVHHRGSPAAVAARRPLWWVGLVSGLVASAASVVVFVIARIAGVPMQLTEVFDDQFRRMSIVSFVVAPLLDGALLATVTAAACRRWTRRPRRWFVTLATIGAVVSLELPIASDGTTATKVVLCISHVVVALILVPALALALPPGVDNDRSVSLN
jgi:hypothetical protein